MHDAREQPKISVVGACNIDLMLESARLAGAIATLSVLKPGTQTSFPAACDVTDLL
ncbi:MAG: hypothetical protein ACYC3X_08595 [Pirellulaceae bacterium]